MNPELEIFCGRLLSAACTGVYQGLLVTAVMWLGLRLLPRTNAATRHAVGMATLVLVAALPILHFLKPPPVGEPRQDNPQSLEADAGINGQRELMKRAFEPVISRENLAWETGAGSLEDGHEGFPHFWAETAALEENGPHEEWMAALGSELEPASGEMPPAAREESEVMASSEEGLGGEDKYWLSGRPEIPKRLDLEIPGWAAVLLVGIWAVLGSIRLGKVGWQCWRLHSLKREGGAAPEDLQELLERIRGEMNVARPVRLITSPEISAPMAAGFLKPAVLLPTKVVEGANSSEIEHLLRHEMAHLRRGDDWSNLVQQIIKAALFFHPVVWWLSRRATLEREIACDDHVLALAGSPRTYALLLTEFAGRMQSPDWAAAPAAWSRKSQLKERIGMILDQKRNSSTGLARTKVGALAAAGALMVVLGWQSAPQVAFGQESSGATAAAATGLPAEETVVAAEPESPARTKPSRGSSAVIYDGSVELAAPASGSASSSVVRFSSGSIAEPHPTPGVSARVLPAAPRMVEPKVALRIEQPLIAQVDAVPVHPPVLKRAPAPPKPGRDGLEERVERLERLIESLAGKQKKNPFEVEHHFDLNLKKGASVDSAWDAGGKWEEHGKQGEKWSKFGPNEEQLARIHEQAEKMAQQASREAERAAREAHRMAMSFQFEGKFDSRRQALEAQRRALEQEKQALERQMERLEGMIEKIEAEEESIEEQEERERERRDHNEDESADAENLPGKRKP